MNKVPRLIVPGLNFKSLKVYDSIIPIGYCIAHSALLLVWRSQITVAFQSILKKPEIIQSLDSQKQIASLVANSAPSKFLLSAQAVANTLYMEGSILANEPAIKEHIFGVTEELMSPPTKGMVGKILPTNMLTEQNVEIHRRGLMGKIRGIQQTRGIYNPAEIVQGVSPSILRLQDTVPLLEVMFLAIGITSLGRGDDEPIDQSIIDEKGIGQAAVDQFLLEPHIQRLIFNDGVIIGNEGNLLPFEESLNLAISRPLPVKLDVQEVPKDANPLTELIISQRNQIAINSKPIAIKKAPGTNKTKAPPKETKRNGGSK
jgi:hypothetical protein